MGGSDEGVTSSSSHVEYLHKSHLERGRSQLKVLCKLLYLVVRLLVVEGHHRALLVCDGLDLTELVRNVHQLNVLLCLLGLRDKF